MRALNSLSSAERDLAAAHTRIAFKLANRYARIFPLYRDDIESAATYALTVAARDWKDDGRSTFNTYAGNAIVHAIARAVRDNLRPYGYRVMAKDANGEPPPTPLISSCDEIDLAAWKAEDRPSPFDVASSSEDHARVNAALATLDEESARLIRLRYGFEHGHCLSRRNAQDVLGITEHAAKHGEYRAIANIAIILKRLVR